MLRYVLFDLDNTLYPPDNGLWGAITERINLYMIERLHMPPAEVSTLRRRYLNAFGNTLTGLRHDFAIDGVEYLNFVHDLPLDHYLCRDPALDAMLSRLPQVKVIFTNADTPHAGRVLDQLGIRRHFTHIIDILALNYVNKPEPKAYRRVLELLAADPAECVYVEDTAHNLPPAHDLGMCTVLVGVQPQVGARPTGHAGPAERERPAENVRSTECGIDHQISHILELEALLAEAPCRAESPLSG